MTIRIVVAEDDLLGQKERLRDRAVLLSAIRSVAAGASSVDSKIIDVTDVW